MDGASSLKALGRVTIIVEGTGALEEAGSDESADAVVADLVDCPSEDMDLLILVPADQTHSLDVGLHLVALDGGIGTAGTAIFKANADGLILAD